MVIPRLIRQRDAPKYLGMSEPMFNKIVRPYVPVVKIGRAIFYDRLDLDAFVDHYMAANGKPGKLMEETLWQNPHPAFEKKAKYSTLTKQLPAGNFEKALEKRNSKRPNAT